MNKKGSKIFLGVLSLGAGITASIRSYNIFLGEDDPDYTMGSISVLLALVLISGAFLLFKEAAMIDSKPRNDVGNQLRDFDDK
jgi:hypothetical protein